METTMILRAIKEAKEEPCQKVESESFMDEDGILHSGNLIVDATCCDAEVKYPTDLNVFHDAVKVSDRVIESLSKTTGCPRPRSFLKAVRTRFLGIVKKRRESKSQLRKGVNDQLYYLAKHINSIVDIVVKNNSSCLKKLKGMEQQFIGRVIKVYYQQKSILPTEGNVYILKII